MVQKLIGKLKSHYANGKPDLQENFEKSENIRK
jgi:hypothetical protein